MCSEIRLPDGTRKITGTPLVIGDPCSFIPMKLWDDFCRNARGTGRRFRDSTEDESLSFIEMGRGAVTWRGVTMLVHSTGGDGDFFGVPVDSGIVVVINEADLNRLTDL